MHRSARFSVLVLSMCLGAVSGCSDGGGPQTQRSTLATITRSTSISTSPTTSAAPSELSPTLVLPPVMVATDPGGPAGTVVTTETRPRAAAPPSSVRQPGQLDDPASVAFDLDNYESSDPCSTVAVAFIRALSDSDHTHAQTLADPSMDLLEDWEASLGSMPTARVIDAVIISKSSGRSVVAVSIASPELAGGLVSEPIAYLVELAESADAMWLVTGMSFA